LSDSDDLIPTLPLETRRKILGYIIPLMNFPLMIWKIYQITVGISTRGLKLTSLDTINDLIIISFSLILVLIVPNSSPIYASSYWFTPKGLKIKRLLKGTTVLPYDSITRVDLYLRDEKKGEPNKEALDYARDSMSELRRMGFKISDYTNSEKHIALVFSGNRIYMITPAYPKAFVQKLRKQTGRLNIKTILLTPRGERIKPGLP
jgi:hypothetical protein